MSDTEARNDELLALNGIFDENVFKSDLDKGGEILIHCKLPEDFHLFLRNEESKFACQAGARLEEKEGKVLIPISFLPPLVLRFDYPEDYPSCSAPHYSISCRWLSQQQINVIRQSLDNIWKDNKGEVILFLWADYLENESLNDLELTDAMTIEYEKVEPLFSFNPQSGGNGVIVPNVKGSHRDQIFYASSPESTITEIVNFDLSHKAKIFKTTVFSCGICYSDVQGIDCVSFMPCQHVYCKECVTEHFSVNIKEGRVLGLCCPETDCESMAIPGQVRDMVDDSLFQRYDSLLLQTSLDSMDDIFYCPRPGCGEAVIKDESGHLATCSLCRYVFCTLCGKPNHGVFDCQQAKREKIELMKRMKREEAERMDRELEEIAGEAYVLKKSKRCPSCGFHIQKSGGCNKMTCCRCRTYFCWVCMQSLDNNPYDHFEDPKSKCFHLLHSDLHDDDKWLDRK
ncbi:E3 ubiquitin-protein ligase RNF14-like [Apostichopus japonicus]|uniref:E3 ubiquitin-protein ligase RNF14-like n=1 Tax=Stichopus japonicus TaxID=307972 RepID=UPI003AB3F082